MLHTDLDHRIRRLEHQLATVRWRDRAVCAVAIVAGLVFACKGESTSNADHTERADVSRPLKLGRVTVDENGLTITNDIGKVVIDAIGIHLTNAATIDLTERKLTSIVRAGSVQLHGEHDATVSLSADVAPSLNLSHGNKRLASLSANDGQSALQLTSGRGDLFVAASDKLTAIQVKTESASVVMAARNDDGPDAMVTTSVGDKAIALAATKTKADLEHGKH